MTEQVKISEVKKTDKIFENAGYWEVPLSAIKQFEKEQRSAVATTELMRKNPKQIEEIMKTKW